MPAPQYPKTLNEALALSLGDIESILVEPVLPLDHPDAAAQSLAKRAAQAAMDNVTRSALKRAQEIISQPPLPAGHPDAAVQAEIKRAIQILLLRWNAHYAPGGPYEGLRDGGDG
jgi:hypothetical protein